MSTTYSAAHIPQSASLSKRPLNCIMNEYDFFFFLMLLKLKKKENMYYVVFGGSSAAASGYVVMQAHSTVVPSRSKTIIAQEEAPRANTLIVTKSTQIHLVTVKGQKRELCRSLQCIAPLRTYNINVCFSIYLCWPGL